MANTDISHIETALRKSFEARSLSPKEFSEWHFAVYSYCTDTQQGPQTDVLILGEPIYRLFESFAKERCQAILTELEHQFDRFQLLTVNIQLWKSYFAGACRVNRFADYLNRFWIPREAEIQSLCSKYILQMFVSVWNKDVLEKIQPRLFEAFFHELNTFRNQFIESALSSIKADIAIPDSDIMLDSLFAEYFDIHVILQEHLPFYDALFVNEFKADIKSFYKNYFLHFVENRGLYEYIQLASHVYSLEMNQFLKMYKAIPKQDLELLLIQSIILPNQAILTDRFPSILAHAPLSIQRQAILLLAKSGDKALDNMAKQYESYLMSFLADFLLKLLQVVDAESNQAVQYSDDQEQQKIKDKGVQSINNLISTWNRLFESCEFLFSPEPNVTDNELMHRRNFGSYNIQLDTSVFVSRLWKSFREVIDLFPSVLVYICEYLDHIIENNDILEAQHSSDGDVEMENESELQDSFLNPKSYLTTDEYSNLTSMLIKWVKNKEKFFHLYRNAMCFRLLNRANLCIAKMTRPFRKSLSLKEKLVIQEFNKIIGPEYTIKFEKMLRDAFQSYNSTSAHEYLNLSKNKSDSKRRTITDRIINNNEMMPFSPSSKLQFMVGTADSWPLEVSSVQKEFSWPIEISNILSQHQNEYCQKFSGRLLTWLPFYTFADIEINFRQKSHIFFCSGVQICILLCLLKQESKYHEKSQRDPFDAFIFDKPSFSITIDQLEHMLNLNLEFLWYFLQPMIKKELLNIKSNDGNSSNSKTDTQFETAFTFPSMGYRALKSQAPLFPTKETVIIFNNNFTHPDTRIELYSLAELIGQSTLPRPHPSIDKKSENQCASNSTFTTPSLEHRLYATQAAIVRILKTSKQIAFSELYIPLAEMLQDYFIPDKDNLPSVVEGLAERGFLTIVQDILTYLP